MKTLLISVFDSNMVRNILRTNVLRVLKEDPSIGKIVLLVHPTKLEEYTKEFASEKVVLTGYPSNFPTKGELVWWFILRHTIHTKNVRAKINELLVTAGGGPLLRFAKFLAALSAYYVSYLPPIRWLLRSITTAVHADEVFADIIKTYQPDVVFLPTIFATNDIRLLKHCKRMRIPTIGMIKSWDNLLGKDPLLLWPDRLILHNDLVKQYAIDMHHFPVERMYVAGMPQMDVYADPAFPSAREQFFADNHLNPNKKLIVYAAVGKLISYHEPKIMQFLGELVGSGALREPAQLLIRLHPAYPSDEAQFPSMPDVHVVRPGKAGAERNPLRFDFEFQEKETKELASTLKWADVVIQSGSTMAIDAACFDTPIINLGFDGYIEDEIRERSTRRLLIKDHFQRILDTGGTRSVYSRGELVEEINAYLADRTLDHEGRMRIVQEQCYMLDGKAGERIGQYIALSVRDLTAS